MATVAALLGRHLHFLGAFRACLGGRDRVRLIGYPYEPHVLPRYQETSFARDTNVVSRSLDPRGHLDGVWVEWVAPLEQESCSQTTPLTIQDVHMAAAPT